MIIASNFKTNHTRKSTKEFIDKVNLVVKDSNINNEILIFPPSTALDNFNLEKNIYIGAQNAYFVENGSFTGEIGLEQLDEFNIKTILIGHSERRALGEDNILLQKKFEFFKENNFKIVFCIGENVDIQKQGLIAVIDFLKEQLSYIDLDYKNLIIAYEPIWAIGTGLVPTKKDIEIIFSELRDITDKKLLYGGSVKVNNIDEILSIENVDGVLVGSGSWDVNNFIEMIKYGS